MRLGYARVSTADQDLTAQLDALRGDGCEKVFTDKASGQGIQRAGLQSALAKLKAGDVFTVWSLDRLGRSLSQLVLLLDELHAKGIQFRSLREAIDTSSAGGRLQLHMLAALAEFERARIAERTRAGLQAAKKRGRVGGRPTKLTPTKKEAAQQLLKGGMPPDAVARSVGVSRATLYRHGVHQVDEASADAPQTTPERRKPS